MEARIALELIPKSVIDDYAKIGCIEFGDILIQAMGINGGCSLFTLSREKANHYLIAWVLDSGEEYDDIFSYEVIERALVGKCASIEIHVYTK